MAIAIDLFTVVESGLLCELVLILNGLTVTTNNPRLYLASQSPRRAELLQQIAICFELLPVAVDETPLHDELPKDYVLRLAIAKAQAGWQRSQLQGLAVLPVLGADTSVVLGRQILGKPSCREEGLAMLKSLAGRTHQVMTAVCLCLHGQLRSVVTITEVTFRPVSELELQEYWATGEPLGKAGAYAIQGRGAVFVERIQGSYSAVVGLPLLETSQLLTEIETIL